MNYSSCKCGVFARRNRTGAVLPLFSSIASLLLKRVKCFVGVAVMVVFCASVSALAQTNKNEGEYLRGMAEYRAEALAMAEHIAQLRSHPAMQSDSYEDEAVVRLIDDNGFNAAHVVASRDTVQDMRHVHSLGVDIDRSSAKGVTPLMLASYRGALQIVDYLVVNGIDVSAEARHGLTALHYAVLANDPDSVRLLLEAGANPNVDSYGNSPLIMAIYEQNADVAKLLVESGSDVNAMSQHGQSALSIAQTVGVNEIAMMLKERGATADIGEAIKKSMLESIGARERLDITNLSPNTDYLIIDSLNNHLELWPHSEAIENLEDMNRIYQWLGEETVIIMVLRPLTRGNIEGVRLAGEVRKTLRDNGIRLRGVYLENEKPLDELIGYIEE